MPAISAVRPRPAVGWDALVAVALGAALLAGGWLDVRAYLSARGKSRPAFALMSTAAAGQRIGWNEFFAEAGSVVHLGNVGRLEWDDPHDDRTKFRQALGPVSTVEIWSERTRGRLELRLRNPAADQTIAVACNGRPLEEIHLDAHAEIARQYGLELRPGANEFTLTFARYHPSASGERPVAARLLALDLYLPSSDGSF
ncbi:MAG: hypothetical protein INR65_07735 [Gluconacetobacter diazotrophicus]|nr:hypothetical protein [Gluconacetobacter diazotrophicus]